MARVDYEARFAAALRRITAYMSLEQLRRKAERSYGLSYDEALEMAYENVQGEARAALHGYRKPRVKAVLKDGEAGASGSASTVNDAEPEDHRATTPSVGQETP
jgi:hypothetical protein